MHRRTRLLAIAGVFFCVLATLRSQTAPTVALPLPEDYFPGLKTYLEAAVRQAPRMVARNTQNVIEEADRMQRRAGQLPSVSGYASYYPWTRDDRRDQPELLTSEKTAYSFTLSQPVFHWGALRDNSRIGDLKLKLAEGQTGEVYRVLVQEIRGQYLQLIVRKLGLLKGRAALQVTDEQYELARTRFEAKQISSDDMFNATLARDQTRLAMDRAEEDFAGARRIFGRLCGTDSIKEEDIPIEIPAVSSESSGLDALVQAFLQGGPDTFALRNVRNQIAVERLNYKIASARLRPKLNFVAGASQDEQSYTANIGQRYGVQTFFTGAVVSWSIFDGFATRGAKMAALAQRRQMEQVLRDATGDTIAAVQNQRRQVEFSRRGLDLAEKSFARAAEALHRRQEDFARGQASQADIDSAQLAHRDQQIGIYNARADYIMRVADILSLTLKDPALSHLPAHP